jgi:serine phosphatase RsbU (regulator of sigma subunit)
MAALACLLAVAAALILLGALRSRRLRAQRERLAADVGALQAALLPVVPDRVGPLAVSVAYQPAAGLAAGGDFYDVFPLEHGRVGILVGDVSGHGRDSLGAATFTRHMARAYLEAGLSPREALRVAGHVANQHRAADDFTTLLMAVYDPTAGTFSYSSAGHPPPIVLGPAAHNPMIAAAAPPLGTDEPTGLRQTTVPLPPGSTAILFTDGLFEARTGGTTLGRSRLTRIAVELGPDATASELVQRVDEATDSVHDDVAVCVIRVDGEAAGASTVRVEELEVADGELDEPRVRRFLMACGIRPTQTEEVVKTARARAFADGSVLLRVRLARDRSGVDVLPARETGDVAAVARLAPRIAVEQ